MAGGQKDISPVLKWILAALIAVIAAVILTYPAGFCSEGKDCSSFFERFNELTLNEKGDALAGVFSPLAFGVAMLALLLQGRELRLTREQAVKTAETLTNQTNLLMAEADRQEDSRLFDFYIEGASILHKLLSSNVIQFSSRSGSDVADYSFSDWAHGVGIFELSAGPEFFRSYRLLLGQQLDHIEELHQKNQLNIGHTKDKIEKILLSLGALTERAKLLSPIYEARVAHYEFPLLLKEFERMIELGLYLEVEETT